jgi:hypothetical protein
MAPRTAQVSPMGMSLPPEPPQQPRSKTPLDPLVKTALLLSFGLILITVIGMMVTAPDRSIPPYTVVAQVAENVSVSVPPQTTDPEIEALLFRFRVAGEGDRAGFRHLKIKPTTPQDPGGRYERVTIYILDNPGLAEESILREYVGGPDPTAKRAFERHVRGMYRLGPREEFGTLGFVGEDASPGGRQAGDPRMLFRSGIDRN